MNPWKVEKEGYLSISKAIKLLDVEWEDFYGALKTLQLYPVVEVHNKIEYKFLSTDQIEDIRLLLEDGVKDITNEIW